MDELVQVLIQQWSEDQYMYPNLNSLRYSAVWANGGILPGGVLYCLNPRQRSLESIRNAVLTTTGESCEDLAEFQTWWVNFIRNPTPWIALTKIENPPPSWVGS